jgi:hypothetical protein
VPADTQLLTLIQRQELVDRTQEVAGSRARDFEPSPKSQTGAELAETSSIAARLQNLEVVDLQVFR